jgi:Putative Flp pilus-assembly TadE/G-like
MYCDKPACPVKPKAAGRILRDGESGQTMVLFAFLLAFLIGMASLVIDVGMAYQQDGKLQAVADSAALAGVQELPDGDAAEDVAKEYIAAHGIDIDSDDYEISIETPYAGDTGAIEVTIEGQSDFVLGRVAGVFGANVNGRAVADSETGIGSPYSDASIVALHPTACKALEIAASGNLVAEGPIMINSNCNSFAAEFSCSTNCNAMGGIESVGGVKNDDKCNPCVKTTIAPFADPLGSVLPPCFPGAMVGCTDVGTLTVRNGTAASPSTLTNSNFNFQPGIYYGGMDIGGTVKDWAPGVYIIAGGGLKINTSTAFTAEGVFIYNTRDPGCPSCSKGGFGKVEINTSTSAKMSAMPTGPYEGLLFFQDRSNTEPAKFNPSASFGIGTIYFPNAHAELNPSATAALQIIASTVKINNSTSFTADWNEDALASGAGAPTFRLVE